MTRLPLLCAIALLAFGLAVDCGDRGGPTTWIGTPHRAAFAEGEGSHLALLCRCRVRVLSVRQIWDWAPGGVGLELPIA